MFTDELYTDDARAVVNLAGREITGIVSKDDLKSILNDELNRDPLKEESQSIKERRRILSLSNDPTISKASNNMVGTVENARANYLSNYAENSAYSQNLLNTSDVALLGPEREAPEYVGTGALSEMLHDPYKMQKGRTSTLTQMIREDSVFNAAGRIIDRHKYANSNRKTKEEAESFYKGLGLDIKESVDGISEYEMRKKADTLIKKQDLEMAMSLFYNTNNITFLNKAEILGTALAGGLFGTPLDTASTTAALLLPELAVFSIARSARTASTVYKTERVLNAMSKLKTAKNIATTVNIATDATRSAEAAAVGSVYGATMAKLRDPKFVKMVKSIEDMKNLKWDSLSGPKKTLLDASAWSLIDIPNIAVRKYDAEMTGIYQYSGKDAISEFLLSGSLGVVLPGTLRAIGKALNITPFELTMHNLNELETSIKADVALGKVLPAEAKIRLAEVGKLKENLESVKGAFKKPHPVIQSAVDELERANVSTETLKNRIQKAYELMRAGIPFRVWDLPEFESIFSHINARVLNGLLDETKTALDVFGKNLVISERSDGLFEARVIGETGLLGRTALVGTNERELIEQLGNMYRGFVLEDPYNEAATSLSTFTNWVRSNEEFVETLESIFSDYLTAFEINKGAKAILNVKLLARLKIKDRLEDAFLKHYLGEKKFLDYNMATEADQYAKAYGTDAPSRLTDEMKTAEKEAEAFSSKWLVEYKRKNKKSGEKEGTGVYDFVSKEGKDDKGATFSAYLESLRQAQNNNVDLANSGNIVHDMEESRIQNWLDKVSRLEVSDDTNMNYLFGAPRQTFEDLKKIDTDNASWNSLLTRTRMEVEAASIDKDIAKAKDMLSKYANNEKEVSSVYNLADNVIKEIDKLKASGFVEVKNNFFNILRTDRAYKKLSAHIDKYIETGRMSIFLKDSIKTGLSRAFADTVLGDFIKEDVKARIVNNARKHFMQEIKENPEILKALYSLDRITEENPDIRITSVDMPFGVERAIKEGKEAAIIAEFQTSMDAFFSPLSKIIDTELTRIQLQKIHDMDIMQTKFKLMMQYPQFAPEILTAGATQSVYDFTGSRRNLEYIRRSAGLYEKDIHNILRNMSSEDGLDLSQYLANKDNLEKIQDAIADLTHGKNLDNNSDAYRVAKVILDEISTVYTGFSKHGSTYHQPFNMIDRKQLKYADAAIPDTEVNRLTDVFDLETQLNVKDLLASMTTATSNRGVKYGDEIINIEQAEAKIKDDLQAIQEVLDSFLTINNNARKKVGLWAFRSFKLSDMFDQDGIASFDFDEIRDAIFSGNLKDLIGDDYLNLYHLKQDITSIRTKIIGDTPGETGIGSWVDNFYNGLNNLGAIVDGRKSAYLDAFESRILFKDENAEKEALRLFGYTSTQKMLNSNFDLALKAQYSLETYGSDPLGLVHELLTSFEKMRTRNKEFRTMLTQLAKKNGTNPNSFEITKTKVESVERYTKDACGMREMAPSTGIRIAQALRTLASFSLLAKAPAKSMSDWSTITENLIANGLVNRKEALGTLTRSIAFFSKHPELSKHLTAASVIEAEDLLSFILNDPAWTMAKVSDSVTWVDKLEAISHKISTGFLDKIAHMSDFTNTNKKIAARAIQSSIGAHKDKTWAELKNMAYMLDNEGIDAATWDLMRTHMVVDLNKGYEGGAYWYFDPFSVKEIPDQVLESTLIRQGKKNVSQTTLDKYRKDLLNKMYTLINSSADEFISMPSERVMSKLRFNNEKGSWPAFWAETVTQYQAFPCAMAYNTYGRQIAHAIKGQTGITAIDMFNPFNNVSWAAKTELYNNLFKSVFSIGMTMLLVDSAVDFASGRVEKPITSDGDINTDLVLRRIAAPLGPVGVALDTLYNAIDASGQKGGGISIQMAPAGSNVVRTLYRNKKILASSKIQNKPAALGAEALNELGRFTGLKTLPVVAPIYQAVIGSYLDMVESGGQENWNTKLNLMEKTQVLPPWVVNPKPGNVPALLGL